MAAQPQAGLFTTKSADQLVRETQSRGRELKKVVGLMDLTALGIGAIIGTGIFVIIGEAIGLSGPGIVVAFVMAGVTCAFSALSYAELASAVPVSGSAYTYSYATLGELAAWIIGWDLILEYGVSVAAVAVGWGGYLNTLLDNIFSFTLPESIANPPGEEGGKVNLPAVFLVLAVAGLLIAGVRESFRVNSLMVVIKLVVLLVFIGVGVTAFSADNLTPFFPEGVGGSVDAAALIFFAYIGFDAISTSGEETKDPGRDLPRAILGSLAIATALYIAVSIVAVGALPYKELDGDEAPLATVLEQGAGVSWGVTFVSIGALIAITSVVLTILYGQTRIMFAMSRDGLVPPVLSQLWERTKTPAITTAIFAVFISLIAAFLPLSEIAKLVNIGTLFAFLVVNIGVIVLRRTRPDLDRGFRVPFVPLFPLIGGALAIYLMFQQEASTWLRFAVWMAIGLAIYAVYGRTHSKLRRGEDPGVTEPEPA